MRGRLTAEVKEKAEELLGAPLSQEELRLMPYIQYVMVNKQKIDPSRITKDERAIMSYWRNKGWITEGIGPMTITKHFGMPSVRLCG